MRWGCQGKGPMRGWGELTGRGAGRGENEGGQAGLTCMALAISCSDACSPEEVIGIGWGCHGNGPRGGGGGGDGEGGGERRRGGNEAGLTCIALAISCSDACSPSAPEPSPRMFNMMLHQSPTKQWRIGITKADATWLLFLRSDAQQPQENSDS